MTMPRRKPTIQGSDLAMGVHELIAAKRGTAQAVIEPGIFLHFQVET